MKTKLLCSLAWVVLGGVIVSANHRAFAQNANPTGPAGYFNQLSTTGGSYDPYTTNATRTIPELSVAGALGDYPLQWSRTMNSRGAIGSGGSGDLGQGGGWTHSYYWAMADSDTITDLTVGLLLTRLLSLTVALNYSPTTPQLEHVHQASASGNALFPWTCPPTMPTWYCPTGARSHFTRL